MAWVNKVIQYIWMYKQFIFMTETATDWVNEVHHHILKLYEEAFQVHVPTFAFLRKFEYFILVEKINRKFSRSKKKKKKLKRIQEYFDWFFSDFVV